MPLPPEHAAHDKRRYTRLSGVFESDVGYVSIGDPYKDDEWHFRMGEGPVFKYKAKEARQWFASTKGVELKNYCLHAVLLRSSAKDISLFRKLIKSPGGCPKHGSPGHEHADSAMHQAPEGFGEFEKKSRWLGKVEKTA